MSSQDSVMKMITDILKLIKTMSTSFNASSLSVTGDCKLNNVDITGDCTVENVTITGDCKLSDVTIVDGTATGILRCENTTDSTDTKTGSVIISGGVGIVKNVNIGGTASAPSVRLTTATASNYITLSAPGLASPYSLVMPTTGGTSGQVLGKGTGSTLVWTSAGAYDQNLNTTDSPTFNYLTLTSGMEVKGSNKLKLYDRQIISHYVGLGANDNIPANYNLLFPSNVPFAGQVLIMNSSTEMKWKDDYDMSATPIVKGVGYPLMAAGTDQSTATLMTKEINYFVSSFVGSADGARLPTSTPGVTIVVMVHSGTTNPVKVYAPDDGFSKINDGATSASVSVAVGSSNTFVCVDATSWYSMA